MEEAPRPGMAPARLQGCNAPKGVRTLPLQPPACALLISEGWLRDAGRNALSLPTRAGGSFPVLQHSNHHHCAGDRHTQTYLQDMRCWCVGWVRVSYKKKAWQGSLPPAMEGVLLGVLAGVALHGVVRWVLA